MMSVNFDSSIPQDWSKNTFCAKTWRSLKETIRSSIWLQALTFANGQTSLDNLSVLLHVRGEELSALVKSKAEFLATSGSTKVIESELFSLFSQVEDLSLPLIFLLYERHKFFSQTQSEEETVCEFANSVKTIARFCEFQENEDSNIASRIRNGLRHQSEKEKIEDTSDTNLKLLHLCELLNEPDSPLDQCPLHSCRQESTQASLVKKKPSIVTIGSKNKQVTIKTPRQKALVEKTIQNESELPMTLLTEKPTILNVSESFIADEPILDIDEADDRLLQEVSPSPDNNDLTIKTKRMEACSGSVSANHQHERTGVEKEVGDKIHRHVSGKILETGSLHENILSSRLEACTCNEHFCDTESIASTEEHNEIEEEQAYHNSSFEGVNIHKNGHFDSGAVVKNEEFFDTDDDLRVVFQQQNLTGHSDNLISNVKNELNSFGTGIILQNKELLIRVNEENRAKKELNKHKKHASKIKAPKYKCSVLDCGAAFVTIRQLKYHKIQKHSKILTHRCKICSVSFRTADRLFRHMRLEHPDTFSFQCDVCETGFRHMISLKKHKLKNHKNGQIICKYCQKKMPNSTFYEEHKRVTHRRLLKVWSDKRSKQLEDQYKVEHREVKMDNAPQQSHKCITCGASFTSRNSLKEHMHIHTSEKSFECTDCGQSFQKKVKLVSHLLSHVEDIPFLCGGSRYKSKSVLQDHKCELKEYEKRKSSCKTNIIADLTSCRPTLKSPQRKHTVKKPYKCNICLKTFPFSNYLKDHVRIRHKDTKVPKMFSCVLCGKSFKFASHLKGHVLHHS